MSKQTTPAQRREFYEHRQRDGGSNQTTYPHEPRGRLSEFDPRVRYGILRLRSEHPHWGPGRIRANLKKRPSLQGLALPSDASIGRYLHQWPCFRRQTQPKPPPVRPHQPTAVHQRWQIDFKVGIALRAGFARWHTLRDVVQTDGESTLVTSRRDGFPTLFTLWLAALGKQAFDFWRACIMCQRNNVHVSRAPIIRENRKRPDDDIHGDGRLVRFPIPKQQKIDSVLVQLLIYLTIWAVGLTACAYGPFCLCGL